MASAAAAGGEVDLRLLTFLSHPVLSLCRADEGLHQGAERAAVQQCGGASERTEVRMDVLCFSSRERHDKTHEDFNISLLVRLLLQVHDTASK